MGVTAEDLRQAVHGACAGLETAAESDWSVIAGDLTWSCRATGEHLANAFVAYAGQLVGEAVSGWVPFDIVVREEATPLELLSVIRAAGELLAVTIATRPASARGWHPYGMGDREAFAAMGIVETCVHTHDIAQGLQLSWSPPADLCERALGRLFPERPAARTSWECLLWCTGRAGLADLPRRTTWSWQNDW